MSFVARFVGQPSLLLSKNASFCGRQYASALQLVTLSEQPLAFHTLSGPSWLIVIHGIYWYWLQCSASGDIRMWFFFMPPSQHIALVKLRDPIKCLTFPKLSHWASSKNLRVFRWGSSKKLEDFALFHLFSLSHIQFWLFCLFLAHFCHQKWL